MCGSRGTQETGNKNKNRNRNVGEDLAGPFRLKLSVVALSLPFLFLFLFLFPCFLVFPAKPSGMAHARPYANPGGFLNPPMGTWMLMVL